MLEFIKGLFSEADGKPSMKRFGMFVLIIVFSVAYSIVSIKSSTLIDIPMNWAILIGSILGFGTIATVFKK